ncbi:MAG: response regulator [Thermoflexales bacterium]|nr:response regulator [Thermoflexales bacterium]
MRDIKPILLVEDDEVDAMTVKRAMREIKLSNPLQRAGNGEEALALLRDTQREKPYLILLDLNMPKMNGIEFLRVVKQDKALRRIPVVVLTTSKEDQDRLASFELSVAGYMVKPVEYADFVEMMHTLKRYWSLSERPD